MHIRIWLAWLLTAFVCWPICTLLLYRYDRYRYPHLSSPSEGWFMSVCIGLLLAVIGPVGVVMALVMTSFAKGGFIRQRTGRI